MITHTNQADLALGMNQPIPRRDFMNSMMLGSGAALLGSTTPRQIMATDNWTGYGGVGDYARSNGNTFEVINAGHQILDRVCAKAPPQATYTGEVYDWVVAARGVSRHALKLSVLT